MEELSWTSLGWISRNGKNSRINENRRTSRTINDWPNCMKMGGVRPNSVCKIYDNGRNNWMTNTLLNGFNESVSEWVS